MIEFILEGFHFTETRQFCKAIYKKGGINSMGNTDTTLQQSLGIMEAEASNNNDPWKDLDTAGSHTNLTIDLITDAIVDANIKNMKMMEVTSASTYSGNSVANPDGIFSPYIFGTTAEEKKKKYGYIELHCHVFHPFVYEIISKLNQKIPSIVNGISSWTVTPGGEIKEVLEGEEGYDPDNTGLDWIYENFDKMKFKNNDSRIRIERVNLIKSLKRDEAFITKWMVIPIFYRDVQISNGIPVIPEIDSMYNSLIQYSQQLKRDGLASQMNRTKMMIQMTLVNIRKHGQQLVEKKNGFFKKCVLGKSTDYGFRSVISVPNIQSYDKPDENPIDCFHTGVPLAQCCSLGFPLVAREVQEFFRQQFDSLGNRLPLYEKLEDTAPSGYIQLDDPMTKFTTEYIHKKIDLFNNTPGTRFRLIHVNGTDGKSYPIKYFGAPFSHNTTDTRLGSPRYLTWTDVLYMCAVKSLKDKHVYITRYPLNDYFGTFPSRIHVLSTTKTMKMAYGAGMQAEVYNFYPVITPGLSESQVSLLFNDTLCMSNTYLKGLNGDYDGDMVTEKMVFSQEANEEAEEIMHSERHYVNIAGQAMRDMGKESTLCLYCMTRDPD